MGKFSEYKQQHNKQINLGNFFESKQSNKMVNLGHIFESSKPIHMGFNIDTFDDADDKLPTLKKDIKSTSHDVFKDAIINRFSHDDGSELNNLEIKAFEILNNNPEKYVAIYMPADLQELKKILLISKKYLGEDGNYNWIDTSNITSLNNLFHGQIHWNGDITKWNTSKVINMLGTFSGCNVFNRDLSNWDVSNVKYISAATFSGCLRSLYDCFNAKDYPNKVTNFS